MLGRTFIGEDNDPGAPPTVVLSYAIWRDRFAADSNVVGKILRVNGRETTIIGVMPDGFHFPQKTTMAWLAIQTPTANLLPSQGPGLTLVGRLRAGTTPERASGDFRTIAKRLATELPKGAVERTPVVEAYVRGFVPKRVYTVLYSMLAAVFMVLLVACGNVANLLLERAVGRTREIGIRTALGATRLAVIRQSLVESTIIAGLAAIVGIAIAQGGIVLFNRMADQNDQYFWTDIRLHPPVLIFVLVMAMIASLVSGLLPALQSARLDIGSILKDESHAASSLRVGKVSRMIVGIELAVSSALIIVAAFMTKSLTNLRTLEPGFRTADVLTARITLPARDTVRQRAFFDEVERELSKQPGFTSVYLGSGLPGVGWGGNRFAIEGKAYARERDYPLARTLAVNPGFFGTFGIRVVHGRAISTLDRHGAPGVAVVSESFVRRHFPDADPIGRRIRMGQGTDGEWLTIVGVVPTLYASTFNLQEPFPPEVLTAFWQARRTLSVSIAVRGEVDAATPIRKVVAAIDPEIPVYDPATMRDVIGRPTWPLRLLGTMFVIFGVVSLVLAAIGLYAVMSFSVSRRIREMGIRLALGASPADVIRLICHQGARQIGIGISIGVIAGAGLVRVARAVLFDVKPGDPMVFAVVAVVLGVSAFVSCNKTALASTRVDPLV
jgi:predicted permease